VLSLCVIILFLKRGVYQHNVHSAHVNNIVLYAAKWSQWTINWFRYQLNISLPDLPSPTSTFGKKKKMSVSTFANILNEFFIFTFFIYYDYNFKIIRELFFKIISPLQDTKKEMWTFDFKTVTYIVFTNTTYQKKSL